ncbi:MAG: OadG family transporter subunit [Eubacteriales bacterium]|nr:OadG family transporter subunit [Eubacteriales bacterium]
MLVADRSAMFTATVVIAGISIVLGVLLLLILVFYLFGAIVSKAESKGKGKGKKKDDVPAPAPAVKPAPAAVKNTAPAPVVEQGISGEVVAAIAAAVAVSEGPQAVVRSIKKVNVGGRNPWASAAVSENTRPF